MFETLHFDLKLLFLELPHILLREEQRIQLLQFAMNLMVKLEWVLLILRSQTGFMSRVLAIIQRQPTATIRKVDFAKVLSISVLFHGRRQFLATRRQDLKVMKPRLKSIEFPDHFFVRSHFQ